LEKKGPKPSLTVGREELLVDGSDELFRTLVHNLFAFLNRHEAIRSGHAKYIGLAGIEYSILISISRLQNNQDVSIKAVGDHLHVTGAFVTRVVHKLVELGLVHKEVSPADKRRVSLTVTADGMRKLNELSPIQRKVNDVEFASLTRGEFVALAGIVERLVADSSNAVALQSYLEETAANAKPEPAARHRAKH